MSKRKGNVLCAFISAFLVLVMIFGTVSSLNLRSANAENDKTEFSSEITAVRYAHGEKISILPEEVRLFSESTTLDIDYLKDLYEYTDNHRKFNINNNERLVELYRKTDAFNPVDIVLRWQSSLDNVKSYKVRVAYDNKFTECVIIEPNADINEGVAVLNPLAGTTYYWQVIATLDNDDKVYSRIFDFTTENSLRTVTVEGVSNTRDIGGYETVYGYVKQGLVYRSARLESLAYTEAGLDTFKNELGIKSEIDLRGTTEIGIMPTNKQNAAGLNADNCFVWDWETPYYADGITTSDVEIESSGIDGKNNWEKVKAIMSVFSEKENYPIDFHCAIGRDRTGTFAALLKAVLGFSEQDIINDYFISAFSTTGTWDKNVLMGNKDGILFVLKYLNSFNGDTLADKTAEYLITKCGMTQTQIDDIRNIMTGKDGYEVEIPAYNTQPDTDNYAGYAFVTFEKFGTPKAVKAVLYGETVNAPFDLGDGLTWTVDGAEYDFSAGIEKDMTVIASEKKRYEIKVVSTGAINSQEIVTVNEGESFDFSILQKDGYDFTVVSDDGKVITELTVIGKSTINVIYVRK